MSKLRSRHAGALLAVALLTAFSLAALSFAVSNRPAAAQSHTHDEVAQVRALLPPVPGGTFRAGDLEVHQQQIELVPTAGIEIGFGAAVRATQVETNAADMLLVDAGGARIAIRTRHDGDWGTWTELEAPTNEAPDSVEGEEGYGSVSTMVGPIWIAESDAVEFASLDANLIRINLELLRSAASSSAASSSDASSSDAVGSSDAVDAEATSGIERRASQTTARPAIQPRSAWTDRGFATHREGCEDGPIVADDLRAVVVHHSVTTNSYGASNVDDLLRGIYRLHVDINGWCDIAYNFAIDRFGTIWQARSGNIDDPVIGGHTKGFNTSTSGIVLLGQHQSGASPTGAAPTSATTTSLNALIDWKLSLHGLDPNGVAILKNRSSSQPLKFAAHQWITAPVVAVHRDLGLTACPGNLTLPSVDAIRAGLRDSRVGDPPYAFSKLEPYDHGPGFVVLDQAGGLRPGGAADQPLGVEVPSGTSVVAVAGGPTGGQVLVSDGRLIPYGDAPATGFVASGGPFVDVIVQSNGASGWVLTSSGGLQSFGGTPGLGATGVGAIAADLDSSGKGYVAATDGSVWAVGGAPAVGPVAAAKPVSVAVRSDRASGWVLDASGTLHPFGGAPNWQPASSVVGAHTVIVGTNDRGGWIIDSVGRFTPFGAERPIVPTSTTVGVPTILDGALVTWVRDDRSELIRFVNSLTSLFLGNAVSPAAADVLAVEVVYGNRADVISELAHSDAWAGRVVEEMYLDVLGRPPDEVGRAYWVTRLRDGLRTQDLGQHFYASPEYVAASGSTTSYVRRLYQALLDRSPEEEGLAYWTDLLEDGRASPGQVAAGFYQSIESRRGRVAGLYRSILQRSPDAAGHEYWAARLLGIDDIALAVDLAASSEYYELVSEE